MTTKTITIMEDAYKILAKAKKKGESFSDTIRRVVGKKKDISEFSGIWSDEYADSVKINIKDLRKRSRKRTERRDDLFNV